MTRRPRRAERREHRRSQALRHAVATLPPDTVRAMLDALESEELIAGAYSDRHGRVCPMLAAHRRGARAGVGSFPSAWDAFTRTRRPRAATERELAILRALLQEACAPHAEPPAPATRTPVDVPAPEAAR